MSLLNSSVGRIKMSEDIKIIGNVEGTRFAVFSPTIVKPHETRDKVAIFDSFDEVIKHCRKKFKWK